MTLTYISLSTDRTLALTDQVILVLVSDSVILA